VVIDTSAMIALLGMEPEAARIALAIEADATRLISAPTLVEASIVVEARHGPEGGRELDLLVARIALVIESVTREQAEVARDAWRRYGRGHHPAELNLGDCFSYALARVSGEPLLFKGDDFHQTDIAAAPW
jgi:ribonuclease VapC